MPLMSQGMKAALLLAAAMWSAPALAQTSYQPPRTSEGRPDLQGIWSTATATPMERPDGYPLVLSREQAAEIEGGTLFNRRMKTEASYVDPKEGPPEKGRPLPPVGNYDVAYTDPGSRMTSIGGELRSSWVVFPEDGRIPELTEAGVKLRESSPRRRGTGYDNPEERGLGERCVLMSGGPPLRSGLYNNNVQIVQTPSHIMLMVEMVHDVRVARIGGSHPANGVAPWMGDPVARWEGDTLVIETRNVHPDQSSDRTLLSTTGKITERFTRISDRQMLYQFEIDDPTVYASVWRGETAVNRVDDKMYEFACHEGNYGLYNILQGGRTNDRQGVANATSLNRTE